MRRSVFMFNNYAVSLSAPLTLLEKYVEQIASNENSIPYISKEGVLQNHYSSAVTVAIFSHESSKKFLILKRLRCIGVN